MDRDPKEPLEKKAAFVYQEYLHMNYLSETQRA